MLRAFGPAIDEIGEDLMEMCREWRWRRRNVEAIAGKHQMEVERRGLDPKNLQPLPEGDAYRAMEAASLEDDESVQNLWAGLLTSAMDPNSQTTASKVFVDLLQSIGPAEAGLLSLLRKTELPVRPADKSMKSLQEEVTRFRTAINNEANAAWRHFDHETQTNAVQNLMRLRCIGVRIHKRLSERELLRSAPMGVRQRDLPASAEGVAKALDYVENLVLAASGTRDAPAQMDYGPTAGIPEARYQLTPLGRSLMKACLSEHDADASHPVGHG
jgi:hypothetical protein